MISLLATRAAVIGGCGVFALIMGALHILRPDLPPLERGISRYAGGDTLALATAAFLVLASAWVALAISHRAAPHAQRPLSVGAIGLVIVAATPIGGRSPSSIVELAHTIGGLFFYLGTARAMLDLPAAGTAQRPFTVVYVTALSLFVLGAIGMPLVSDATGLLQRIIFATALLWALHCATTCEPSRNRY